jgi:predicted nucleotidyltransferase
MLIESAQILQEIKQAVLEVDSTAEVVLFGSRARGDFHEESDWDILILVDKEEADFKFKKEIRNALFDLELKYGEVITGIVCNRFFWKNKLDVSPLYLEVQKDGVVL